MKFKVVKDHSLPSQTKGYWDDLVSMAIVRNPLSRLASVYFDKIASGKWKNAKDWREGGAQSFRLRGGASKRENVAG